MKGCLCSRNNEYSESFDVAEDYEIKTKYCIPYSIHIGLILPNGWLCVFTDR